MERAACSLLHQRITATACKNRTEPFEMNETALGLTWSIPIHMCYENVVFFFTVLVPVDRFGELWTLFMGESTSDTATLLRESPPLSEESHSGR